MTGGGGDDDDDTQLLTCGRGRFFKVGSGLHNMKGLAPMVYSAAPTARATCL